MKSRIASLMSAVALAICVPSAGMAKPLVASNPASPLMEDYKGEIERLIPQMLRDPESARFDYREPPYIMVCKKRTWDNTEPVEVWFVNVFVNGRNAYGGYAGFTPYSVAFVPGPSPDDPTMLYAYEGANGGPLGWVGRCKRRA